MNDTVSKAVRLRIEGGSVLIGDRFVTSAVDVTAEGLIRETGWDESPRRLAAEGSWSCPAWSMFTATPSNGR
ncbi:MAG: hypothetical protein ACXW3G_05335 [Rhodoplanes sp.]